MLCSDALLRKLLALPLCWLCCSIQALAQVAASTGANATQALAQAATAGDNAQVGPCTVGRKCRTGRMSWQPTASFPTHWHCTGSWHTEQGTPVSGANHTNQIMQPAALVCIGSSSAFCSRNHKILSVGRLRSIGRVNWSGFFSMAAAQAQGSEAIAEAVAQVSGTAWRCLAARR